MSFCSKLIILLITLVNLQESINYDNSWNGINSKKRFIERPQTRIVGGELADAEVAPMMVSIKQGNINWYRHCCAGSLISSRTVLTAAHCCNGTSLYKVMFDGLELDDLKQSNIITKIIIHPGYNGLKFYDLCILHLADEVISSGSVKFIRVADDEIVPGEKVLALGWGNTDRFEGHSLSDKLKQATLTVFPRQSCKRPSKKYPYWICVKSDTAAMCKCDSGGPIIFNKKLVGVASMLESFNCTLGIGAIYMNAPKLKKWIEDNKL